MSDEPKDVTEGEQARYFIKRNAEVDAQFFLHFNHSLMHMPVIPREEFKGGTGQGDWADSLLELDIDFGALLDLLDEIDIADNTLVVFAGDNGAGSRQRRDHARRGLVTTILHAAGVNEPADRVIDGVDQLEWFAGKQAPSARDGYVYWMGPEVYGVKWRNFKLALIEQKQSTDPVGKFASPRIINLASSKRAPSASHLYLPARHLTMCPRRRTASTSRQDSRPRRVRIRRRCMAHTMLRPAARRIGADCLRKAIPTV